MNARRFTLGLSVALSVLVAAVSACGGSGKPKIKSFAASSTNVPLGGAEVTFTWDVSGEDRLELQPYPGAVHGTGITLTVSETTMFTLVAKGNGRSDRESLRVGVGDAFTVVGRVVTPSYASAEGTAIYVNGSIPVIADEAGAFRVEGVVAPYDLYLLNPSYSNAVTVYQGLTRPDPTVISFYTSTDRSGGLNGTLSGVPFPTPTPPPETGTRVYFYSPEGIRFSAQPNAATGTYSVGFGWSGPESTEVSLSALRWTEGPDGLPDTFDGFARTSATVTDGDVVLQDLDLTAIGTESISGTLDPSPEIVGDPYVYAGVTAGGNNVVPFSGVPVYYGGDSFDLPGTTSTSLGFTRKVPDVPDATFYVTAYGPGIGGYVGVTRHGLAAGATGVEIELPAPPRILLPVQNAVVTSNTTFAYTAPDDTIGILYMQLNSFNTTSVLVVTDETTFTFPDFSAIGLGPDAIFSGYYYVSAIVGPFGSLDEAAGPGGLVPAGDVLITGSAYESRNFYFPGVGIP